jgi:DNA-binding XRE family transcriptional regulator
MAERYHSRWRAVDPRCDVAQDGSQVDAGAVVSGREELSESAGTGALCEAAQVQTKNVGSTWFRSDETLTQTTPDRGQDIMKLSPTHTKAARAMLGLTQSQLAQAAGVDENTVSFFESGRTVPREDTLTKIQAALERRGISFRHGGCPGVTYDPDKVIAPN